MLLRVTPKELSNERVRQLFLLESSARGVLVIAEWQPIPFDVWCTRPDGNRVRK